MKMSHLFSIAILGIALVATPVYAQRGGGGGRSGGGSHSSGSSMSRGGGGSVSRSSGSGFSSSRSSSSSSRSSFSSSRSSSSSSSRSSSSSSSRSSFSSPSRSSSSYSGSSSRHSFSGSSSRSSFSDGGRSESSRSGFSSGRSGGVGSNEGLRSRQGSSMRSRTGSVPAQARSRAGVVEGTRGGGRVGGPVERNGQPTVGNGRPRGVAPAPRTGYARPGHPGPMPPSHRPMHPAPYFWHPHHHCMVHCHRLYWDPFVPRPYYWPGFWVYCDSYWYDYHVTDVVVVREYVRDTYKMDLITYAFSGDYMYALVNDPDGHTYLQIYDRSDKLLAEQQVSRKYCKIEVDPENGGCWIMKKRDKDPLLFFYTEDGQLLIYEAD